jgi:hypothetical protein
VVLAEAEVAAVLADEALFSMEAPNAASPVAAMELRLSVAVLLGGAVTTGCEDEAIAGDEAGTVDGPTREA